MELAKLQILSSGGHGALLSTIANSMLLLCMIRWLIFLKCATGSKLLSCIDCALVMQMLPGYLHYSCACIAVGCESTGQRGTGTTG